MSVITPSSTITLCSVPMRYDDPLHSQLYFDSKADQDAYFSSLESNRTVEGCTYIRKDGVLRVPVPLDTLLEGNYNYVQYKNNPYNSRTYYAFITGMEYANDETTFVSIKTDVVQTYMKSMIISLVNYQNYIEREIVAVDTPYAYTYPESLETGDYIKNTNTSPARYHKSDVGNCYIIIAVSDTSILTSAYSDDYGSIYNATPSGFHYIALPATDSKTLTEFLRLYDSNSKGDAIQFMFLAPSELLDLTKDTASLGSDYPIYWLRQSYSYTDMGSMELQFPSALGTYTPRNKKLLCYPYCYFIGTNRAGTSMDYNYEDFAISGAETAVFNIYGSLSVGCSVIAIPTNYKNIYSILGGYDYGLSLAKYPSISWSSDVYLNWLTSNALNMSNTREYAGQRLSLQNKNSSLSQVENMLSGVADLFEKDVGGAISSGFNAVREELNRQGNQMAYDETIANLNAEKYQHELNPPQAKGNLNLGDVQYATDMIEYALIPMCIKPEYAKMIDDYFDMFGYQYNTLAYLHPHTREIHNYWKIKNANFQHMPMDAAQELQQIFENGIAFWNKPEYFGHYEMTNTENENYLTDYGWGTDF